MRYNFIYFDRSCVINFTIENFTIATTLIVRGVYTYYYTSIEKSFSSWRKILCTVSFMNYIYKWMVEGATHLQTNKCAYHGNHVGWLSNKQFKIVLFDLKRL